MQQGESIRDHPALADELRKHGMDAQALRSSRRSRPRCCRRSGSAPWPQDARSRLELLERPARRGGRPRRRALAERRGRHRAGRSRRRRRQLVGEMESLRLGLGEVERRGSGGDGHGHGVGSRACGRRSGAGGSTSGPSSRASSRSRPTRRSSSSRRSRKRRSSTAGSPSRPPTSSPTRSRRRCGSSAAVEELREGQRVRPPGAAPRRRGHPRRATTDKAPSYTQAAEAFANRLITLENEVADLKKQLEQTTQAADQAKQAVAAELDRAPEEADRAPEAPEPARPGEDAGADEQGDGAAVGHRRRGRPDVRRRCATRSRRRLAKAQGMADLTDQRSTPRCSRSSRRRPTPRPRPA